MTKPENTERLIELAREHGICRHGFECCAVCSTFSREKHDAGIRRWGGSHGLTAELRRRGLLPFWEEAPPPDCTQPKEQSGAGSTSQDNLREQGGDANPGPKSCAGSTQPECDGSGWGSVPTTVGAEHHERPVRCPGCPRCQPDQSRWPEEIWVTVDGDGVSEIVWDDEVPDGARRYVPEAQARVEEVRASLQAESDENFEALERAEAQLQRERERLRRDILKAVEAGPVLAEAVTAWKDANADPAEQWDVPGNLCEVRDVFLDAALSALSNESEDSA